MLRSVRRTEEPQSAQKRGNGKKAGGHGPGVGEGHRILSDIMYSVETRPFLSVATAYPVENVDFR